MALSDLSIRKPVFAWMLMIGLIAFGAIALMRMGVSQLPDVDFPIITISLRMEGAPDQPEVSVPISKLNLYRKFFPIRNPCFRTWGPVT